VNDSFGHHVGDEALVLTAETLKECFPNDFVARLGGDEFLVAIVGSYADGELKERTTELLNKLIVRFSERSEFSMLSASAGIAVSENKSQDKHDIDNLMRRSDNALYEAKKTGRGKYCVY
jgi:diguanylate cyclase (GGDEF)-like protein